MFDLGASLTAARESRGLSLSDAEKRTCLRQRYLEALECERFEELPSYAYARAFLRSYADTLELDADMFVEEFTARYPEPEEDEPIVTLPRRRRRFPVAAALVVAALAAAVGAVVWSGSSHSRRLPPFTPVAAKAAPKHIVPLTVTHTTTTTAATPPKPQLLVVEAVNGRCWLLVRRANASGAVLYEGILEQGERRTFGPRVWVRLGAPWNVTIHRGDRAVTVPPSSSPENLVV